MNKQLSARSEQRETKGERETLKVRRASGRASGMNEMWTVGLRTSYLLTNIYSHVEQTVGRNRQWPSLTDSYIWPIACTLSLTRLAP